MTWALCIAAWWVLSVPIGILAVRFLIPAAPREVGATFVMSNSGARRAPIPSPTPARVTFNG